jgi:hypothetical protein
MLVDNTNTVLMQKTRGVDCGAFHDGTLPGTAGTFLKVSLDSRICFWVDEVAAATNKAEHE